MDIKERSADVMIVGSGGAGLRASLEAARKGAKTLLVSKAPIGLANCTIMSGGAFSTAINGLQPEAHFKQTMETGKYLNNAKLVEILVLESPDKIMELEEMGVELVKRKGSAIVKVSSGSSMIRGKRITRVLEDQARKAGVEMEERVVVLDLIQRDNRVTGAIGYNYFSDQIAIYQTKSLVIATGGAGAIYARHDNPDHITGDGFALLYRAGVKLQDMEMIQFYPVGLADPQHADFLVPPYLIDEGKILNAKKEDVKEKYGLKQRPIAVVARDSLARAIFQEILLGNGIEGALYLDLTKMPEEKWHEDPMSSTAKKTFIEKLGAYRHPLRICPLCHHSMGGVVIDENCQAAVGGLYAAGEVTGGVHGANRLGGNALSETLVFGTRAGANAALYAFDSNPPPIDRQAVGERINVLSNQRNRRGKQKVLPESIKQIIQETMWDKVGLVRSKEGLEVALRVFKTLEEETLSALTADSPRQFLDVLEVSNMIQVGQMITLSALAREESRGAHYRTDFSEQKDKEWFRNIYIQNLNGKMSVEIGSVALCRTDSEG